MTPDEKRAWRVALSVFFVGVCFGMFIMFVITSVDITVRR